MVQVSNADTSPGGVRPPIVIAVMGMTGAGKSSFIKKLTGDARITVGHSLNSCTKEVQVAKLPDTSEYDIPDSHCRQIQLIDTPGFDDTNTSDADILLNLTLWLGMQHKQGFKLSGLIYLHRITDDRIGRTARRNLTMLRDLVGEGNMRNVVLVTTRWENIDPSIGEERENQSLLGSGGFWEPLVQHGASHERYDGTLGRAKEIIGTIIRRSPTFLRIQEELASGRALKDTAAGQTVISNMKVDAEERDRELEEIKAQLRMATENLDRVAVELAEERKKYQEFQERQKRDQDAFEKATQELLKERICELEERWAIQEEDLRQKHEQEQQSWQEKIGTLEEEIERLKVESTKMRCAIM
ncbi:P-loop containing nucleoside triphosphate hydrolase protein [Kalaharituber pfeilii]|nr:P-loop containing nucleoside triphosphate hydrolase protein [Kalaharituber pfeilii]